ncbi:hypothetical protein DF111_01340 [Burkholderia stagnalis]|uniref:hypothetical protein n=1 Tax=Burkholderia stagnalis TaxID=1503054 RepID=UPI000F5EA0BB|nr:hypothetical protein [Burkholderia stagnalis]RQY60788.1 hypothetical protein DF111_01340 [Burkholderia stagnalis]
MTAGFQAFTDSGLYQIDGSTPNYQLVQAMSADSAVQSLHLAYNDVHTDFRIALPSVTFTFAAQAGPMYGVHASGGTGITHWSTTHNDNGNVYSLTFVTEQPCTVRLFLFDQVPPASSNFGLQVFNERGTLIADSSKPFLRVLDVISERYNGDTGWVVGGAPNPPWHSKSYGVPVLVSAIYSVHSAWSYNDPPIVELTSIRVDGGNVSWGTTLYGGGRKPNFVGFREQYHSRFMVLDGTGLV